LGARVVIGTRSRFTLAQAWVQSADWTGTTPSPVGCLMSGKNTGVVAELVPVLSRGKHRNPRKGACFMEYASYLAGERWSDHPACTHPLLAALGRLVNDFTSDAGRPRLAELVPSVIGLTSDDLRVDAVIALRAARTALPVAAAERQRVMAVSVLSAERVLAELDGRSATVLSEASTQALAEAPDAAAWAEQFTRKMGISPKGFRRHAGPITVHYAVEGIARACVADPDAILYDLLAGAIDDCRTLINDERPQSENVDELRLTSSI